MRLRRVVVAPDKFKGSCSAPEVAAALARGVRAAAPDAQIIEVPLADGGDGTVDTFLAGGAQARRARVHDPLGRPIEAIFALEGTRAILEMASASGLARLAANERDPWRADSRGTGELILAALDAGATELLIGIGGSATNAAGIGMLRALGACIEPPGVLHGIDRIDLSTLDPRLRGVKIEVACDVDNPLTGPTGASAVFGPQKGASEEDIVALDRSLARTADALAREVRSDKRNVPGAGAAGGMGLALLALGATLRSGIEIVAEARGLPAALRGATLCLTGEGAIDEQTLRGKTVHGVARYARACNVPVIAFGGSISIAVERELVAHGVTCVPTVPSPMTLADAMRRAPELLSAAAERTARLLLLDEASH